MIGYLRGRLLAKMREKILIEVGGVGYEVHFAEAAHHLLPALGEELEVHIHTNVREDALQLFGFLRLAEKEMFLLLLSVSGVGPKLGINMLAGLSPAALAQAIMGEDVRALTKLPGVGKKIAERLCLELKEKVQALPESSVPPPVGPDAALADRLASDVCSVLANLGYPPAAAKEAVAKVRLALPAGGGDPPLEEFLRLALRSLV